MNVELTELFCDVDPKFPNRESEPTPESLTKLSETVVSQQADFGIAFDGDGDRGVIVDNTGRVLSADPVGILLGEDILKNKKGIVLANVESSMAVERVLEPLGATVNRIRVGHTFLTLEAKKQDAILGIERSGHMIMPEYFLFDDAMVIPLRIAEILSKIDEPLSQMVDRLPNYPKDTKNYDFPDNKKFIVIDNLKNKFTDEYDKVNTMDGVRIDLEHGWGLIRASNTSPVIRLTVEADSENELNRLMTLFNNELKDQFDRV
jgi:phosphomannomutase